MKSETYSFGIIMWELLARKHPFQDIPAANSPFKLEFENAVIAGLRPSDHLWIKDPQNLSFETPYTCLMKECWAGDPNSRPNFTEVLKRLVDIHPNAEVPVTRAPKEEVVW